MGTERRVAPGSPPIYSSNETLLTQKTYKKTYNLNISNKLCRKTPNNETDGSYYTIQSLTHSPSQHSPPVIHAPHPTSVPDNKLGKNKVRAIFNNISVIQCNLHKAKSAWDAIANTFNTTINPMFLITEPYHDCNCAIPKVHSDLVHYHYNHGTAGPRSCISVHKSLDNACWEIKQFSSRDCMAVKIDINNKKVILAFIYMDIEDASFPPKPLVELEKYAKQIDAPLIIGSDINSHHILWGDKKQDIRGEVLFEHLYSCDMSWANRGSRPTFVNSRGYSSVIDLTLTNNKG